MSDRQLLPIEIKQGANERIARKFDIANWGDTPTGVVVTAWDVSGDQRVNVSDTVLVGTVSVAGDVITTPLIGNLTAGKSYRIDIRFTLSNGNTYEPYFIVTAEA